MANSHLNLYLTHTSLQTTQAVTDSIPIKAILAKVKSCHHSGQTSQRADLTSKTTNSQTSSLASKKKTQTKHTSHKPHQKPQNTNTTTTPTTKILKELWSRFEVQNSHQCCLYHVILLLSMDGCIQVIATSTGMVNPQVQINISSYLCEQAGIGASSTMYKRNVYTYYSL